MESYTAVIVIAYGKCTCSDYERFRDRSLSQLMGDVFALIMMAFGIATLQ